MLFCLLMGCMVGTCILVGNNMGANKPDRAFQTIKFTAKISIIYFLVFIAVLFFARKGIASFYFNETNDSEANSMTVSGMAALCLMLIPYSL